MRLAGVLGPGPEMAGALATAQEHLESEGFEVQGAAGWAAPAARGSCPRGVIPWADVEVAWGWERLGAVAPQPVTASVRRGDPRVPSRAGGNMHGGWRGRVAHRHRPPGAAADGAGVLAEAMAVRTGRCPLCPPPEKAPLFAAEARATEKT